MHSCSKKPLISIILWGVSSKESNIAASIGTDCLKKGVYSIEEAVSNPY